MRVSKENFALYNVIAFMYDLWNENVINYNGSMNESGSYELTETRRHECK